MTSHLRFLLIAFVVCFARITFGAEPTFLVVWPQPKSLCQQPLVIGLSQRDWTPASEFAADPNRWMGIAEEHLWNALNDQGVTILLDPRISEELRKNRDASKQLEFRPLAKHPKFPLLTEMTAYARMVRQIVGREVCYEPLWFGTVNRRNRAVWQGKESVQIALTFVSEEGLRDAEGALISSIRRYSTSQPKAATAVEEMVRLWESSSEPKAKITLERELRAFLLQSKQTDVERFAYELGAP